MNNLIPVLAIIFGLVIGSFLNVIIFRVPRKLSIITPGSACPICGIQIRPWHNIPVVSFMILRGRCSNCSSPISWRYPAVETLTALWFFMVVYDISGWATIAFGFYFGAVIIALAFIDAEHGILPDKIVLPSIAITLVMQTIIDYHSIHIYLLSGATTAFSILLLNEAAILLLKKPGFFGGDLKYCTFLGIALGPRVIIAIFLSLIFGALAGIIVAIKKRQFHNLGYIPFGPFLSMGAAMAYLWGIDILKWYLQLLIG